MPDAAAEAGTIEVVYASILGLLVPALLFLILKRSWRLTLGTGRKSKDRLLTPAFVLQLLVLAAAWYGFQHYSAALKSDPEFFDPYEILQLPTSANRTEIRSAYRKLSLRYHPDKNPGDRKAAKKFNSLALAHKALSDPAARRNWELYGHPDGYQHWTFGVAMPTWLSPGKEAAGVTVAMYIAAYIALLAAVGFGAKACLRMWEPSLGGTTVTSEDTSHLLNSLDEDASPEDVLECIAATPQLCSEERKALVQELRAGVGVLLQRLVKAHVPLLTSQDVALFEAKPVEEEVFTSGRKTERGKGPHRSACASHNLTLLLGAVYGQKAGVKAAELDEAVRADQDLLLKSAEVLLDVCAKVAVHKARTKLMGSVVQAKARVRRRLWSHDDKRALALQKEEMDGWGVAVPRAQIGEVKVETWGEDQIAVGDQVTATIEIQRDHAEEYRGLTGKTPLEGSPVERGEPWWVVVANHNGAYILGVAQALVSDPKDQSTSVQIKFAAPSTPGKSSVRISLLSPTFVGVDSQKRCSYEVVSPDQIGSDDD